MRLHAKLCNSIGCAIAICLALLSSTTLAQPLRLGVKGDLNRLDPHVLNETFMIGLLGNVMEGLVRRDRHLRLRPALATSWTTLSPTHWRFHLRRGVRFHDGSPFTADDVVYSMARARAATSQMRMHIPADARFVKVDRHTVDVRLHRPAPTLHYGWDNLFILSRSWAIKHHLKAPRPGARSTSHRQKTLLVGTGPYKLSSHKPGIQTVFLRNEDWWGRKGSMPQKVIVTTIRADATCVAALFANEIDISVPAPLAHLRRIDSNPRTRVVSRPELRTIFINLDSFRDELQYADVRGRNPFKDRRVRRAIAHALDTDLLRRKIMRGQAMPSALLVSPSLFAAGVDFKRRRFDLDRARKLMADAGYAAGFGVTMDCPNNRYVKDAQLCVAISHMLAKINLRVGVRAVPKAQFFERVTATSGYDSSMSLLGWTPATMDGLEILTSLAGCRDEHGNGALFNLGGYCNPAVDRLANEIRTETDLGRRDRLLATAFGIIHRDAGLLPLHQQMIAWGVRRGWSVSIRPDNQIRFHLVRKTEMAVLQR